jgi:hypothetical protein
VVEVVATRAGVLLPCTGESGNEDGLLSRLKAFFCGVRGGRGGAQGGVLNVCPFFEPLPMSGRLG